MKLQIVLLLFIDLLRSALMIVLLFMVIPIIWNDEVLIGKEPDIILILLIIVICYSIKVSSLYERIKELKLMIYDEGD